MEKVDFFQKLGLALGLGVMLGLAIQVVKLAIQVVEAQWPIGYGVGLRIKRSSVRIRPWPLR